MWNATVETHRREVRAAILDTTAALAAEHGLLSVTMSRIADATGIGRATLYKYFADVEAIMLAWHERQITDHLQHLIEVRDRGGSPGERLESVLGVYAALAHQPHGRHDAGIVALLHRPGQFTRALLQVREMFRDLLADAARAGDVRDDVTPDELASFCLHALTAAGSVPSAAAAHRLVTLVLDALRPQR